MKYFSMIILMVLAACGTTLNGEGGSSGTYNHVKVGVPF